MLTQWVLGRKGNETASEPPKTGVAPAVPTPIPATDPMTTGTASAALGMRRFMMLSSIGLVLFLSVNANVHGGPGHGKGDGAHDQPRSGEATSAARSFRYMTGSRRLVGSHPHEPQGE